MSRAIDVLVAEKVMGWPVFTSNEPCCEHEPPYKEIPAETQYVYTDPIELEYEKKRGASCSGRRALPHYSTDIAAAWQVVEKMKSIGWRVAIEDFVNRYRVNYSRGVTWEWRNNIEHVSVPLAICLAALRALNVELPKENA